MEDKLVQIYSYSIPELDTYYTRIPIYNKDKNVISILMKNRHRFLTQLFHLLLRTGMPYCYNAFSIDDNPIFKIDCIFAGVRYTLLNGNTLEKLPIMQKRVQLIEKMQYFIIDGNINEFKKDHTYSGILKLNGEKVAYISNLDNTTTNLTNRIRIEAVNDNLASLSAILYQTFIHEK